MTENHFIDIELENGDTIAVSVCASKNIGKRDIIIMEEGENSESVRSVTELANNLSKRGVSFEVRKKVLIFVSQKLMELEYHT